MNAVPFLASLIQDVQITTGDGSIIEGTMSPASYFDGGFIMYPLTFCAIVVLALSARAGWRIMKGSSTGGSGDLPGHGTSRIQIDGILFWGAMALVLGFLGTAVGIAMAAQAVEAVGVVETPIVWGGIKSAIVPTIVGLLYFSVAALLWFGVRFAHRRRVLADVAT